MNITNITQISEDLWNLVQSDMDERAFQVQRMLADELDCYKGKGNDYMDSNIKEIQELYMEEEKKEDKGTVETKKSYWSDHTRFHQQQHHPPQQAS